MITNFDFAIGYCKKEELLFRFTFAFRFCIREEFCDLNALISLTYHVIYVQKLFNNNNIYNVL